jgi:hypothetical protein
MNAKQKLWQPFGSFLITGSRVVVAFYLVRERTRAVGSVARVRRSTTTCGQASGRFQFDKRRQLSIRTHNETPSVAAMRVSSPDRSSVGINC